jgi:Putative amidoligase enzyme
MQQLINNIINLEDTKTAKIIALLELGLTRKQIAELQVLGKYGAIQNVFAKWQTARLSQPSRLLFTPTVFNRKFGIEIEAYGVEKGRVIRAINDAGVDCRNEGYNHDTRPHWKIVSDGSLSGYECFEIVSPILEGENGLEQLRKVSEVLVRLQVKINRTCGLHVHFDAAMMTLPTWKNLIFNYASLEDIIDTMMPQSRRGNTNTYCKSLKIANLNAKLNAATTIQQVTNIFPNRYHKVNTQAYSRHNTIEFRQHSGTIEAEKMVNWILFLHNLVSFSEQNKVENATFETLKKFNNSEVVNFYHNRIQDLAA